MTSYNMIRDSLRSGDVIAFEKIPITGIRSLADIGGWLSNQVIRLFQKRGNVDNDGYENLVHVAVVLRDDEHNEVMGFEYTSNMKGLVPFRMSERIWGYLMRGGHVHLFRLNAQARHRFRDERVNGFIKQHRNNGYAWEHLIFAQLSALPIRPFWRNTRRNRYFCSAGVLAFLIHCGAIAEHRKVLRNGHWEVQPESPSENSPAELLRRCDLFTRSTQLEITEQADVTDDGSRAVIIQNSKEV